MGYPVSGPERVARGGRVSPVQARFQQWKWDLAAAVLVTGFGLYEAATLDSVSASRFHTVMLVLGLASSIAMTRHLPGAALAALWITSIAQAGISARIMLIQLAVVYVAFGMARWGGTATLALSAVSIPAAVAAGIAYLYAMPQSLAQITSILTVPEAVAQSARFWPLFAGAFVLLLLLVPWLSGLALRLGSRASQSRLSQIAAEEEVSRAHLETEQAREIASLRAEQAQLANDVHDVVGHSLAVILAQAESAQFLPDDDPAALKQTTTTIASAARSSLQDIRQVLARRQSESMSSAAFDELVEGVRAGGQDVVVTEIGVSRPLPPDLEMVAHRVVQEMLTNAIKHGRKDCPVQIERRWPEANGDLRIETQNVMEPGDPARAGQGLPGMRRRLESVGGKIDVRQRDSPDGPIFAVTAWVPVRRDLGGER
jgi:signal transduction histidine kinase